MRLFLYKKLIFFVTNGLHQWILRPKTDTNTWFHKFWTTFNFGGIGGVARRHWAV